VGLNRRGQAHDGKSSKEKHGEKKGTTATAKGRTAMAVGKKRACPKRGQRPRGEKKKKCHKKKEIVRRGEGGKGANGAGGGESATPGGK